jgi:spermidine/putrescine transport system permease protein
MPPDAAAPARAKPRLKSARGEIALRLYTWAVILLVMAPIAVMVVFSFNQSPSGRIGLRWLGFTTYWYRNAFAIPDLTTALVNSLYIAVSSTLAAIILGTPLALALARYRFRGKTVTDIVIFADIAAPAVVVGASLLSVFLALDLPRGLLTIFLAHLAFNLAFVVVVIRARVTGLDSALDRAAADLGSTPWVTFWKVTLPLILPGILGAALLGFALSIDDVIITSFVAGQTLTFPLWVYGAEKTGTPPQVFVLSTFIFIAGLALAALNSVLARRSSKPG